MISYCKVFQAFIWLMLFSSMSSYGQLSQKGTPLGLQEGKKERLSIPDLTVMPAVNHIKLMAEDQIQDTIVGIPYRFGNNIAVNYNPHNSGQWDYFDDGSRLWRMGIHSEGAVSINLAFDKYHLPVGAKLYVYTPDGKSVIGAFTHLNNQEDGFFATTLLMGDEVIIEYFEPADVDFTGEINLIRVTHGYRGPGKLLTKSFGGSGSCNLNVACAEGQGWENQIRSVGMLVSNGNGFCTGALINNTRNDGKPYFLSANHCYGDPSTLVFWFNWQSETCENPTEIPLHDAMSGAVNKARHETSDFWLVELNQSIPEEYNVYLSGWNRTLSSALEGIIASIHHPSGDIKKFSWSDNGVQAAQYLEAAGTGTTHWMVSSWDGATTTEPGSSGSPIFDAQGRIIGQLHGGYANCGNTEADWYGRLGVSWTGGANDGSRLSTWLDPGNTGANAIMGFDPVMDAADPNAPASPSNIMANAAPEGKLQATISWTNPVLTFGGDPLSQIDTISIYRDKILIHYLIDPVPGSDESYIDSLIDQAATYTYTLRATNSFGKSPPVSAIVYVGRDKPGAVNNITLEDVDNNGFLSWEAPLEGSNGGYFLSSSITHYEITRNPDATSFMVAASEFSFLDTTITEIGYYSYTITAVNDMGSGLATTSEEVLLAANGAIFMHTARIITCKATLLDSGGPKYTYQNNENDTLTLIPETEGAKLSLKFTTFDIESDYDFLHVYDGDEALPEYLIGSYSGPSVPTDLTYMRSSHTSGAITLVFTSDNNVVRQGWSASIACFIPSDNDLAALEIVGNITPSAGIETLYSVTIKNEGYQPQEEYTVSLVSETEEILSTTQGTLINHGETQIVDILWTPLVGQEGLMKIIGVVTLNEDANHDNNYTSPLSLNVLTQPELYTVTFNVDMSTVSTERFDSIIDQLFITGNMLNWAEPGSQPQKQRLLPWNNNPNIYSLTMQLPAQEYLYKYYINTGWDEGEWIGDPNRRVTINSDTIIHDVFAVPKVKYTRVQFINNAANNPFLDVNIYINGQLRIKNLTFRHTSDFINIPANHPIKIDVTKSNTDTTQILYSEYFTLGSNSSYAAIFAGNTSEAEYQPYKSLQLFMTAVTEVSAQANHIDLLVFHGSTDAPSLSLRTSPSYEKVSEVEFGQFSGYHQFDTDNYVLEVKDATGENTYGFFNGNFEDYLYDGKAAVLLTSGFLDPTTNNNGPEFGLWLSTHSHGQMIELQLSTHTNDIVNIADNILLHPNPAAEYVTISSVTEIQEIRIYDISGKCILNPIAAGNQTAIDTMVLSPGIYFIKIQSSNHWHTKKLIITR